MSKAQEGIFRSPDLFEGRTAHTKCGLSLLASSLAAALLGTRRVSARLGWVGEKDRIFEHPARVLCSGPRLDDFGRSDF